MATTKNTASVGSGSRDLGTSTANWYASVDISAIKTALDNVLPIKYKISSLKMILTVSFTCKWSAKVYVEAGLGETTSINQVILEEDQVATMKTSGSETFTQDITAYLVSDTESDLTTDYGPYFVMRMQSDNVFNKTFTIDSLLFEVTYDEYHKVIVGVSPSGSGSVSGDGDYIHGGTATLTAIPASGYKFVQWSDGVTTISRTITVTEQRTIIAKFEPEKNYNVYRSKTPQDVFKANSNIQVYKGKKKMYG